MPYIIILFLITASVFAKQSDFSVIIDKPFNSALFDITQDYDRDISAVGFTKEYNPSGSSTTTDSKTYTNAFDYLSSVSSNIYGSQIHLIKIDSSANIKIDKAIKLSTFSEAIAVVKTPTNGYFIGGYTLDGSMLIVKLDADGNIIYSTTFGTKNKDKMSDLILLRDGGVLAIGTSMTSRSSYDDIFTNGLGLNDISVTRFSKNGQNLWSKKYGTEHDDIGVDATEAQDGSIVVLGSTSYDSNKNMTLMRITENGDQVWLKLYKENSKVTPYKVITLKDGNILVSLSQQDSSSKEQVRLIKLDLQRNILAERTIKTAYSSALKDIKEYSNETLIGVGFVKDTYNTDALVMILDNSLAMLTQEHYGKENYDMFNAVTILDNSQAAAAGINTNESSQESNMWIVKLNRDGKLAQLSANNKTSTKSNHSTNNSTFYNELLKLFKSEIDAKKLTISSDLSIEFIDKSLYFKVSEYELTHEQKVFLDTFSKKLIPFLNKSKNSIASLEINGHTSSEWGGTGFTDRYLKNEKLSMNRSYSVLSHMFKSQNGVTQAWLTEILRGSGFSYSKKIVSESVEDKEKSRRVVFKIILKEK
jgi:outer membrane protein OmpA-like peptidoglycan-associated protein/co-chaperonin GroES (HSP10)